MLREILDAAIFPYRYYQLKRRAKRGRKPRLRIKDVRHFFSELNDEEIRYVVLRWFDEVPLAAREEEGFTGDIDILVDPIRLKDIFRIAFRRSGRISVDLYSTSGKMRTYYKRMPYYPPSLAEEILESRRKFKEAFFVPSDRVHFKALAYHFVYHKGLKSGIGTGCKLTSAEDPPRPNAEFLELLGRTNGIKIPTPYTLISLHEFLCDEGWNMPYDLLCRWPVRDAWHEFLEQYEETKLRTQLGSLKNLIVFLIREDAIAHGVDKKILEALTKRFKVLKVERLQEDQVERVIKRTRGGDWVEFGKTTLVKPHTAVICHDAKPQPVGIETADLGLVNKHPKVSNSNVFQKQAIRTEIDSHLGESTRTVLLHSSDNDYEAQEYLNAIYGHHVDEINRELVTMMGEDLNRTSDITALDSA